MIKKQKFKSSIASVIRNMALGDVVEFSAHKVKVNSVRPLCTNLFPKTFRVSYRPRLEGSKTITVKRIN